MDIKRHIALVGNPNAGKTLIFNSLTGGHAHVGNWPGVTVEKKVGHSRNDRTTFYNDLPGIYSLSPYSKEEIVTRNFLTKDNPDLIFNVIDSSKIERSLYLTTQILETGRDTVLVLNMDDVAEKEGVFINEKKLEELLKVNVIKTKAIDKKSTHDELLSFVHNKNENPFCKNCANCNTPFKRDALRGIFSKETENILEEIEKIIKKFCVKERLRYYSIKLLEKDTLIFEDLNLDEETKRKINHLISHFEEENNISSEEKISTERYEYVKKLVNEITKKDDTKKVLLTKKIDDIVLNKFLAIPIFIAVMFVIYYITISTLGGFLTDLVNDNLIEGLIMNNASKFLGYLNAPEFLHSLLVDGVISGVGAVIGFLPQICILFIFLSFLEDFGYMSRIAFILDKIFHKFGLSGKSIIPVMIGTGCGVPGIMASRTIENESERKITAIVTTLIPCSAKLPVIALISGALFKDNPFIAPLTYVLGIVAIMISSITLKKSRLFSKETSPFVMELPIYHLPKAKSILIHMWSKAKSFIKKAGTIILCATILVWFLSSFNFSLKMVDASDSMLCSIGDALSIIFKPLGFGDWRLVASTITGFIAKENLVGTMAILYTNSNGDVEGSATFYSVIANNITPLAGFSYLTFNLLCAPCFAAIGALHREMVNFRWTLFAVLYQCVFAYLVALTIFQTGKLIATHTFDPFILVAAAFILRTIYIIIKPENKHEIGFGIHTH